MGDKYEAKANAESGWNECAAIKTSSQTLSFCPLPTLPEEDHALQFVTGKVRVKIHDFSKGKGDAATDAYYNLDWKDLKYLFKRAEQMYLPKPFYRSKIHSFNRDENGRCAAFHFSVTQTPTASDGTAMNNPWCIRIENGTAMAAPGKQKGSFYEKQGTFQQVSSLQIRLSDIDFYDVMEACWKVFEEFRRITAQNTLMPRLEKSAEYSRRTTNTATANAIAEPSEAGQQTNAAANQTAANPPKTTMVPLMVQSIVEDRSDGWIVAHCVAGNGSGEADVWFASSRREEVINAYNAKKSIVGQCYRSGDFTCSL